MKPEDYEYKSGDGQEEGCQMNCQWSEVSCAWLTRLDKQAPPKFI